MSNFNFITSVEDSIILVELSGRLLDTNHTEQILEAIGSKLSSSDNKVVLNLENIEYINSNGLNCFIQILTKARNVGGEAIIVNVPEKINKLLLISKLNTVFTIKESVEEAKELLLTD